MSVTMLISLSMAKVRALPIASINDKNVIETMKLEVPDPNVAAATPRPRTRKGKTSATRIHAIAPRLNAKQMMYAIRLAIANVPTDEARLSRWLKAYERTKRDNAIPV